MIKINKHDQRRLTSNLKRVNRGVKEASEEVVSKLTDKLLEESVLRSPVDEGFLEESHDKELELDGKESIGRVLIPINSPGADYALRMHEIEYSLGERSRAKDAEVEPKVGKKYMERALEDNSKKFKDFIAHELRDFFK